MVLIKWGGKQWVDFLSSLFMLRRSVCVLWNSESFLRSVCYLLYAISCKLSQTWNIVCMYSNMARVIMMFRNLVSMGTSCCSYNRSNMKNHTIQRLLFQRKISAEITQFNPMKKKEKSMQTSSKTAQRLFTDWWHPTTQTKENLTMTIPTTRNLNVHKKQES